MSEVKVSFHDRHGNEVAVENVVLVAPQNLPDDYGRSPSFDQIAYADLVALSDRVEPDEVGTFIMSPRAARMVGCQVAWWGRELRIAAKRRRRVRTRGHGGRRIARRRR